MNESAAPEVQLFTVVVGVLYLSIWLAVTFRLLRTAVRTRRVPETAMGIYFGLLATSFVLGIPAMVLRADGDPAAGPISALALFCYFPAALALAAGTWRMFRPESRWPLVACGVLALEMLVAYAYTVRSGEVVSLLTPSVPNLFYTLGRTVIYAWAFGESLQYYRLARKRVALGLADPLVAQQVLLWGVAALLLGVSGMVIVVSSRVSPGNESAGLATLALSLLASVSIWFAFFPPSFYRRFVAGEVAGTAS